MKLSLLHQSLDGSRRTIVYQNRILLGSLVLNVLVAVIALRLVGQERVILLPPAVEKPLWLESDRVSAEYLEQMAYFLVQLALNVTPQSIDYQIRLLLQYVGPASYGELKSAMTSSAERLKRDGAATVFSVRAINVDAAALKVSVQGQLTTFVSERKVSESARAYVMEFQYTQARLSIKSFRETSEHDPLDSQNGNRPVTGRS